MDLFSFHPLGRTSSKALNMTSLCGTAGSAAARPRQVFCLRAHNDRCWLRPSSALPFHLSRARAIRGTRYETSELLMIERDTLFRTYLPEIFFPRRSDQRLVKPTALDQRTSRWLSGRMLGWSATHPRSTPVGSERWCRIGIYSQRVSECMRVCACMCVHACLCGVRVCMCACVHLCAHVRVD